MSVDLDIKLVRPIDILGVLPSIGKALGQILCLSFLPEIVPGELVGGAQGPLCSDQITLDHKEILFTIAQEPELVNVGTYLIQHALLPSSDQGPFVYVCASSRRTPLEYALAAAVAAAFSRELDTPVIDDTPFFTMVTSQSGDSFISNVRVRNGFADYRAAAEEFYKALPK